MDNKTFIQQQWVKDEIIRRVNYNPDTGSLTWAKRGNKYFDDNHAGKEAYQSWVGKDGYRNHITHTIISGRRVCTSTARLCWLVHTGDWPVFTIDHINRDTSDNRFCNLRDVSQSENNFNKGPYKTGGIKYLSFSEGSWYVRFHGEYFGRYTCLGLALKVRNTELKKRGIFDLTTTIESLI